MSLCQPVRESRPPNKYVSSGMSVAKRTIAPSASWIGPCYRRCCRMVLSLETILAQAGKICFRQRSIPEHCRPRLLPHRNLSSPRAHPHIFLRQQLLARVFESEGCFHLRGSLPCLGRVLCRLHPHPRLLRRWRCHPLTQAFFRWCMKNRISLAPLRAPLCTQLRLWKQ